ncbi:hypothetical protein [Enterococcus ureasiticus]|uniref:Uncharacterized protein n=1 Tax=Enterococcus ureasiticus TaxID=903984 RepID=A0A1E5GC83_9ENTE|nr:hypothetical protein [Enterococcus ureasiticus]OEG10346.1 hypothetical protein BCR21_13435 [Enterococcus ureasiticus]
MKIDDNCIYKCFSSYFLSNGIDIPPNELFFLYGGEKPEIIIKNNEFISEASISNCHFDYTYFKEVTNLYFKHEKLNYSRYLQLFEHSVNHEEFLFLIECYLLELNTDTFRKKYGKHWISVKNKSSDLLTIYDSKFEGVETKENLFKTNLESDRIDYFSLRNQNLFKYSKAILYKSITSSLENYLELSKKFYEDLYSHIFTTLSIEDKCIRNIQAVSLVRSLRSPNSLLFSKFIQSTYFTDIPDFRKNYLYWEKIIVYLLKLFKGSIDVKSFSNIWNSHTENEFNLYEQSYKKYEKLSG